MDFNAVNAAAEGYREDMVKFLRDLVKIPEKVQKKAIKLREQKPKWKN